MMTGTAQVYIPPANNRADISLDSGWRFIQQNVSGAQATGFDDSSWSIVTLPHTWDIPHGQSYPASSYYTGISWYRTHFTPDGAYSNRHFFIRFDGAFRVADVYLNGNFLGEHDGGFAAFVFDATPYLNVGGDNVLAVEVNNANNASIPPLAADFTFWGGIYRNVHLLVTDPVQISPLDYGSPGVYLTTTDVSSNSASLQVTTVVSNSTPSAQTVTVRAVVTDAATNIVTTLSNVVTLPAMSVSNIVTSTVIANPHLWNGLPDPYLYQTFVELWNGTDVVDLVAQPLGFRYFTVDPANGFFLNGRHYDLHGVNMHQDWLDCGWALTDSQRDTNFLFIKEIGATFLRLSHYEHDDYTYQLADQDGICVWSEIPLIDYITTSAAFTSNTLLQLREMVRQRYNHPSIIFWSVYNEITLSMGDQGTGTFSTTNLISQEVQQVIQDDPTRLTTAAANASDSDPSTFYTQTIGFNKYYGWYSSPLNGIGAWADNIHAAYPNRCVGVTEYGAGASAYQHTENPTFPANTGSSFHPEEWQDIVHETNWQLMAARPFLWCKLVWNGFDFAADGRNEGDTPGRNDKGMVTYDRSVRKDAFYFYKANWTTNPMVYITGHTFANRLTNSVTAKVYANCDSVELFLNGISQGVVTSSNCIYTWPVILQSGTNTVQAVGAKGTSNVTDSLIWIAPSSPPQPPTASITNPPFPTVYLSSTNATLQLSATARDNQPGSPPAMTTAWVQMSGPGTATFASSQLLSTTATFSTNGVYVLNFQAIKGALITSVPLNVVVGNVPYGPALMLRYPFDDAGPGTTTPGDASLGSEVNVPLQMLSVNGASVDLHGAAGSGVAGLTNPNRALNLSMNPNQGQSGGAGGSFAAVTNSALGFGNVTNFVVTWWMKQLYYLPANYGPRMFILGSSLNDTDSGKANSISMKWQDASDWYFYVNTIQATAAFGSRPPTTSWMFVAMAYDGTNVMLYEGSDQNPATLVSTTSAAGQMVALDSNAALFLGNRPDRQRCFAGWIDEFRFYSGWGDASFVESVRQSSAGPAGLTAVSGNNQVSLTWNPLLGATSYNLKRSTVSGGPYTTISTPGTVTGTSYVDNAVIGGTTYYYTISAATSLSETGETANSATEAGATPYCAPPPAPSLGYNSPVYSGMTLNLTASTVGDATYNWTGPNGFSSTNQNPSIAGVTAMAAGDYRATVTVDGCTSAPGTVTVTIHPAPGLSAQALNGNLILQWPADGNWLLQYQSNPPAMGLGANWNYLPGQISNPFVAPIYPGAGSVFYRLILTNQ